MLINVLQLGVHRLLIFSPVGEDVSHGATGLVEAYVEAIGVNLRTVCDFKHRLEADALLPCVNGPSRTLTHHVKTNSHHTFIVSCSFFRALTF